MVEFEFELTENIRQVLYREGSELIRAECASSRKYEDQSTLSNHEEGKYKAT